MASLNVLEFNPQDSYLIRAKKNLILEEFKEVAKFPCCPRILFLESCQEYEIRQGYFEIFEVIQRLLLS
jgi:hypothetical protein